MRRLTVRSAGGSYPVVIGPGAIDVLPRILARGPRPSGLFLVTDSRVARHHAGRLAGRVGQNGLRLARVVLPPGERSKSVRQLERLWRALVREGADRGSCLLAFGGGVVGDLAGFAAASILRGVDFIQVPTTLLAMVDASVGGKTGINLPEGKNLVGAFHQPRAVIMDLEFLETLPAREARAGLAEVLKTAAIRDAALLRRLEREREALLRLEAAALEDVVARCVAIKAGVVAADERESGLRRILNFGHTLAHAIEAAQGYGGLLHGEAVAVGMAFALCLGRRIGITSPSLAERLTALIAAFGLPIGLRGGAVSRILTAMSRDKKRGAGGLRWVLLERAGRAVVVDDVDPQTVQQELKSFLGGRS
jgi:3-dehydroquinate synthase